MSIILPTHRKNPYSEAKKSEGAGLRGGAEIAVTDAVRRIIATDRTAEPFMMRLSLESKGAFRAIFGYI
ncbi:hypothetical protein EVAR_2815_1 [Eumeta japonica]|uniref:Uncharacterized protein n=1 Tax=Eumeta variegata TaxID=151549 RepID=A0A4C1T2N2_EUMVA|nr:hypothetical protein EVAR_2815_1 [Eumeta japonica]